MSALAHYRVEVVEQPPSASAFGHRWAELTFSRERRSEDRTGDRPVSRDVHEPHKLLGSIMRGREHGSTENGPGRDRTCDVESRSLSSVAVG
jgi:hypothetical protein